MLKKIGLTIFLFLSIIVVPLFSQEDDFSNQAVQNIDLQNGNGEVVNNIEEIEKIDDFEDATQSALVEGESDIEDFADEFQLGYAMILVEPVTPRFGFRAKNRDPFCIASEGSDDYLLGTKVAKGVYTTKRDKSGAIIADVNQEFFFDYEYVFGVSSQFILRPWLSVAFGFSFGYEQLPFVTNLPDPSQAKGLSEEEISALPKSPTYYSLAVVNGSGEVKGRFTSFPYSDSKGNDFYSASVAYGVFRIELNPSILFFPLKNAGKDLKGLYFGVSPSLGLAIDSPTKIYLDLLYSSNRLRSITLNSGASTAKAALQSAIHEESNWSYIRQEIDKEDAINSYISFYGGARLDLGWQGTFKNGLVLNSSVGIGADSSRKFYLQFKGAIGYLFR